MLAALGHVPFSVVPAALAGFLLALALTDTARDWRAAAGAGWLAGVGYFLVSLHWIVEPFFVDPDRHGWMAPFALAFLTGGLALFWGLGFGAARALARSGWPLALAWAAALTLAELARAHLFTGFPWGLPAYLWSEGPALQIAALTGAYGLSFFTLLLVAAGYRLSLGAGRARLGFLLLPWLLPIALGWGLVRPDQIPADAPTVRIVQPNAPQHLKWDPDWAPVFFDRLLRLSAEPGTPDLVIWPETAVPFRLSGDQPGLAQLAAASPAPVLLGGIRVEGVQGYNSAALVEPDGTLGAIYDKHHLVPFGEYLPLGGLTKYLGLPSFGRRDGYGFMPGPGPRLIDLPVGRALPLICYEAIFPRDVNRAPERPDLLVQLTNDAWFGTLAGPQQHLAQARFRAVEQGLPMIRAANTGISGIIDPAGRMTGSLALDTAGRLDLPLPSARPPTVYARTGDLPWLMLPILLLLAVTGRGRRNPVASNGKGS